MEQIKLVLRVITAPRSAFRALPPDRWYLLAWIAPLYFGAARAFRPPNYERNIQIFGSNWALLGFVLVIGFIFIPLWAWVLRQILKLFRKRLSVRKLMNIYGYALVPRLIVAALAYILFIIWPFRVPDEDILTPQTLVMIILGAAGIIYTMILYVFGIVVSPSENDGDQDRESPRGDPLPHH